MACPGWLSSWCFHSPRAAVRASQYVPDAGATMTTVMGARELSDITTANKSMVEPEPRLREEASISWEALVLTVVLFALAGLLEIGGGWGVWQWRREGKSLFCGIIGFIALALYGLVPTWQPEAAGAFYRVYAAYGCWFIVLSLLWGYLVDGNKPDAGDLCGCALACVAALMITFWPWRDG
eukprot:TRINITY_DN73256_c0_g1_i1.p1 TRINITY_DN73256_c0_g1~~TRINITY_DN73256_c0_g1_i1.p1  ORF type:complete len:200 (-),score=1.41 TRINITY_DN73256_c0_g1_i1:72-614(-)